MRAAAEELGIAQAEAGKCSALNGGCGLSASASGSSAQARWSATPISARLRVLRAARHGMAARAADFTSAISSHLARTEADTLVAELLPLLDACRFLERDAKRLLAPRKLGRGGRPLWLAGVTAEVHREPLGHVLVIGPSNFPLFLPGVQVLQALAAGNTVTWKPGAGGAAVAHLVLSILREAGLPEGVLTVTDESVEAARRELAAAPGKVIFTGSSTNGEKILAMLAKTTTPAVVELSGADAIVVTPSADLAQVAKAVAFGLRLNGGAVCMSPRRLFATPATMAALRPLLDVALSKVPPVALDAATSARLRVMLEDAMGAGAKLCGTFEPEAQRPLLVDRASAAMSIARSDIFAPVLSLIEAASMLHVPELYQQCPFALTASIFCGSKEEPKARVLAKMLKAGSVLVNDVIAPTADPRVPFGGVGASGYGVTRGAEGLLEMTAVKTLLIRRSGSMRHLDATEDTDTRVFVDLIATMHGHGFATRWKALKHLVRSARR